MTGQVIIGCGYTGERLARRLGGQPLAFTGSDAGVRRLRAVGIEARAWDLDRRPFATVDVMGSVVWYLAPPPEEGDGDPRLERCLDALRGRPRKFVYVSTTGVYGDANGGTVTEDTPPAPTTDRARRRLAAEGVVQAWCAARGAPWVILRVPGIYGPGRLPLERIRRGDPSIAEPEAGPGNRIHVDDLVSVLRAAGESQLALNRVYNVGDGEHASSTVYFRTVARLAGLPAPPELPREEVRQRISPGMWSFLADSRRVDATRMREELGVRLEYPDVESGVGASLGQDR
jgi:nucleoside-diphosphate-sugar epimerase